MRKIYATGGWLHYPPLEFYYMQGEINVEPVQFVLPKTRKEVDLTALSYQIKAVSEDYGTEAAWILPKRLSEEHILLDWEITRELTLMPGRVMLTLTGTDTKNNVVAKWTGNPAIIRKDPQGTQPVPPPDKLEQFEKQVNEAVEQIIGALEGADSAITEIKPVLEDATETARELTKESESLRQVVSVLENQTKDIVLPTIWVRAGTIRQGVDDCPGGRAPSPDSYQQLLSAIGDLKKLQTSDKSSLVSALNEVLAKSSGDAAEDSEVGDMLEDVFGEEEESVPDDQVATNQDVDTMLDGVFGDAPPVAGEVATDQDILSMLDGVFGNKETM